MAERRIGIALGILGVKYVSLFASDTAAGSEDVRSFLEEDLGINCFVLVVGDRAVLQGLRTMFAPIIDGDTIPRLLRALPTLRSVPGVAALVDINTEPALFRRIFSDDMRALLNMAVQPSVNEFESVTDPFLRSFLKEIFLRPEMLDPSWLNSFRVLSARMGRGHQFAGQSAYLSLDPPDGARKLTERLTELGREHGIKGDFGYLVPIDNGTRAVMEYDFYYDQTNAEANKTMVTLLAKSKTALKELAAEGTIIWTGADLEGHGLARYQSYLFGR
jgi:hypothetical protein